MSISNLYPTISPSLLLDFANTKELDPRITFTRASSGVYYDGKTVAKAEENLFKYSQEFDNAYWLKGDATVTANATTAPDGTTTADKLIRTSGTGVNGRVRIIGIVQIDTYTFSVFAKADEFDFLLMTYDGQTNTGAWFDLTNGVLGTVESGVTASIIDVGNGWYRCIHTRTEVTANRSIAIQATTSDGATTSTGDGTSGIYIWGAQLEQRDAVTAYTPTTTQPITNYIPVLQTASANVPRFDHDPVTGESLGLLVEEQRTNLALRSEEFDNAAWNKNNSSVLSNQVIAPDGTLTMDKIVTTATNGNIASTVSLTGLYTTSVFFKKGEIHWARITYDTNATKTAWFDLENGVLGTVRNGTASITDVGNGVYRCSFTATDVNTLVITCAANDDQTNYTGDGYSGIYIWGAQLEEGAFPTSYIKTEGSQVTRSADSASMTGANFSEWYRADEGSFYAEFNIPYFSDDHSIFSVSSATSNYRNWVRVDDASDIRQFLNNKTANGGSVLEGNTYKIAQGYKNADQNIALNGGSIITTNLTFNGSNHIGLQIGDVFWAAPFPTTNLDGHIRKLAFYPQRLTNEQLQALTS